MGVTLTILGRPILRAGGSGDLRAFQNAFLAAIGLAVCVALLLLITPFSRLRRDEFGIVSSFFFVFGFVTARIPVLISGCK